MRTDLRAHFDLPPIDQVAYVVKNLDRALPHYEALFGAFDVVDSPLDGVRYRGKIVDCRLRLAINRAGPVEIELIEVLEGETPHSEHLRNHGEGLHHVRFRVEGLESRLAEMSEAGFETIFFKRFEGAGNIAFAYVEAPPSLGGSVIELLEMG